MRSAFNKEIVRSITQSAGRFVAIAIISLLGAGFYAGLRMAAPDMRLAGDEFFDATNMYDFSVVSTLGLDDDSLEVLRATDEVEAVMGAHRHNALVEVGEGSHVAVVESLSESAATSDTSDGVHALSDDESYLNRPILLEGEWPSNAGECVVGFSAQESFDVQLGDVVTVESSEGDEDLEDQFAQMTFTVTGFVNAPTYIATNQMGTSSLGTGLVEMYLYVPEGAFGQDDPYTVAYVTAAGGREGLWDTATYDEGIQAARYSLEACADTVGAQRYEAVVGEAQAELDEARADYVAERADAEEKLADAEAELADAQAQLDSAAGELASGRAQMSSAAAQLASSEEQLNAGEAEYASGAAQLASQREQLTAGLEQLPALKQQRDALTAAEDTPPEVLAQLNAQIAQIEQGQAALEAAESQLAASRAQLDAGWAQLEAGRQEYASGWADYQSGRAEYEQGVRDLDDGRAEYEQNKADAEQGFADAEAELADAQADIDDIEVPDVYVLDRTKNPGAASLSSDSDGITQIATFLPFMFFLVAALVSLTSMTRMVDEERLEIGTHKALGYGKARITSKYLVYGALASGIGAAVGIVLLGKLLPWFILTSYAVSYDVPVFPVPIHLDVAARAFGLSVGVTLLATWAAASASLREKPAQLMLPRVPKAGKRIVLEHIRPLWRRLSFSQKVTARNLLRYKRRFFMAVVGVAGCTALLMVGFGLRDAIGGIVANQYQVLMSYDMAVQVAEDNDGEGEEEGEDGSDVDAGGVDGTSDLFADILDVDGVASYLTVDDFTMIAAGPDDDMRIEVVVPSSTDALGDYVTLRECESGAPLDLQDGAIVLTEKAAVELGAQVGQTISLYDENDVGDREGPGRTFTVGGIAENYLGHYAYLSPETYRQAFGADPDYRLAYVKLGESTGDVANASNADGAGEGGVDTAALSDELLARDEVSTVSFVADKISTYEDMLAVMDKLIIVIVLLSAALAFVVLYNLTNININERVREIATLKVLGFTRREVNVYIFREVIIMALIGAIVGCVLGVPLTFYIAEAAETANMMFGRSIEPASFVLSFVITIVFAVVVAFLMRRKLDHVNMVESLKSVE